MKKTRRKSLHDFRGFRGPDNSIGISLFEYGIAWKEVKKDKYAFVIGVHAKDGVYDRFTCSWYSGNEFIETCAESWFNINSVCGVCGTTEEEFIRSFPYTMYDAISYHGLANIFGTQCDAGFEIIGSY